MPNSFYNNTSTPQPGSAGSSSLMRAEFAAISAGFNKLPTLLGNEGKLVIINGSGTGMEATTSLAGITLTGSVFNGTVGAITPSTGVFTTVGGTTITASTQFIGPGTGLTGTAASLSIGGNAATATFATSATSAASATNATNSVHITAGDAGDLLYQSGAGVTAKLAGVATGNALISGGVGAAPSYGKIGLTTHISGTLAVGNGGTGVATLTGLAYGNGTGAFTAATAAQVVAAISTTAVENATTAAAASSLNATGLGVDQTWTGSQRGAVTTDNDLSFDLNAANNFSCTPTAGGTLTFTNITAGQSGFIKLVNGSNYAIAAHANTKISAASLSRISATGTYILSYFSDGTNVFVVTSESLA